MLIVHRKSHNKSHDIALMKRELIIQNPSSERFLATTRVWFRTRRPRRFSLFTSWLGGSFKFPARNFLTLGEDETTSVLPASETASALLSSPSSVSTLAAEGESATTSAPGGASDLATAESLSKVSSSTFYRIRR